MPKGKLIYCPYCEANGKKEILGAIYKNTFRVLRFHKGETIIISNNFAVYCGKCGEKIYVKETNSISNRK